MDILYIVMPAYNEEDNIKHVLEQWYHILNGKSGQSRLVVADSGSTDRTHEILLEMKESGYSQIEILSDTGKFHGPKLIALYDYAITNGADYIFQTDSDDQTNPDEFEGFWAERENYSGIMGNRTVRGDGKGRAFVEKIVCLLIKIYFGVKPPDANAPFRLMKTEAVKKYLYRMPDDYALPNIMLTTFFLYYDEKTLFKEISFNNRHAGRNSINIIKIIKIGWKSLGDFRKFKKRMKEDE